MKEGFNEELLKKSIEELIELSRKIQEESFDLCYNDDNEISDIAKIINHQAHTLGVKADRIRGNLD